MTIPRLCCAAANRKNCRRIPQALESQGSPLAGTVDPSVYKDAVVVLATAGVVVPLAKSLKVNSIIAFVACGACSARSASAASSPRFRF